MSPNAHGLQGQNHVDDEIHLADYWSVIVKYRRLIAWSVGVAVVFGIVISVLSKPSYRATVVLNVEREKSSPFDIAGQVQYSGYDPEFLPTQTRLMKSREVAERVVKRLNLTNGSVVKEAALGSSETVTQRAALEIQDNIATNPVKGTNLVELSYVASTPKLAADIGNATAEAYIDWSLESKYLVVGQASRFLAAQIEQLKAEVSDRERQLQAYARREDIVSTDPQQNSTLQNLESLNKDYSAAVADRVSKEARYYEVQNARADAIADTLAGSVVSQLRSEQARMEREYAEKLNLFKPDWPAMQQLKAQIDKGRNHLETVTQETVAKAREVARNEYQTALRREQNLKAVLAGQKTAAINLNANAVEYNNLRTEVETKRSLLDSLLKRQAETEVTSRLQGQRVSNIRVVDRALPPASRFRPSYKRNALLSLLFGLGIGVGIAFLLEYLDRSLRTTEAVEKNLRLPALGVIPSASNVAGYGAGYSVLKRRAKLRKVPDDVKIELIPETSPRSTVSEAYRAFRAALLLSRAGGLKTIAVTSSNPGEGKTATSVNLAVVLAQLGKRVLLVDGDLHKPRIHEVFRISNRVGLVSILAENLDPLTAFNRTNVKGLSVVPSGPMSPNPSGLLSSDGMKHFLATAAEHFDYVIIDTPPVSPVADAILLGYQIDGVVLCVKGGVTPREVVARTRDRLVRSNVRILGVLINNLVEDEFGYGKYYSYYAASKAYGDDAAARRAATPGSA